MQSNAITKTYNTKTAKFILTQTLDQKEKLDLYRAKDGSFFIIHNQIVQGGELISKTLPLTNNDAIKCLSKSNALEDFEQIYGKIETDTTEKQEEPQTHKHLISTAKKNPFNSLKLAFACLSEDKNLAKKCIEKGGNINCFNGLPLKKAIYTDNKKIIELLLNYGCEITEYNYKQAILKGDKELFKMIISNDKKADMNEICLLINKYNKHLLEDDKIEKV